MIINEWWSTARKYTSPPLKFSEDNRSKWRHNTFMRDFRDIILDCSNGERQLILGRNGIYFMWVAASYRGEASLWINAYPRQRSLVKFHFSEFRIWKGFSLWGNRGSVACHLLQMKTSATSPQPQVASQHLDGTRTRRPTPLPTAMLVWYGEQPKGITPLAVSRGRTQGLPRGKPVTYH